MEAPLMSPQNSQNLDEERQLEAPLMPPQNSQISDEESHSGESTKTFEKRVKSKEISDCLVCHREVKRLDKHYKSQHCDVLSPGDIQWLLDFERTKNAMKAKIFDCHDCKRRFACVARHKAQNKCPGGNLSRVENYQSRRLVSFWFYLKKNYRNIIQV